MSEKAVDEKPGVRFSDDATEIPPAKPPRPMSPQQQATNTLIEAFPGTDPKVVKAILIASDWNVEKAFTSLLSMSDPNFKDEEAPLRLSLRGRHNNHEARLSKTKYTLGNSLSITRQQQREAHEEDDQSFFNKEDVDEIRRNLEQGFDETKKTLTGWFNNFKKKLDGEPDKYDEYGNEVYRHDQRQNFGPSQSDQLRGIRRSAEARRSADHNRYDNDNRMLGDDFEALELRDDEGQAHQRSNRPLANPDLFKPTPVSPPQSGPVDEVDALYRNPSPNGQQTGVTGNKSGGKKWQPLTSVAPHPESDEHDPFSLGDSDDEEAKTKDIKAEDTERLKKAAEAKKVEQSTSAELTPAGRSGSVGQKDAAAEALLKEAK
ncbi:ubiquitin-binding protein cue5 [Didymosphaeria variabile]|uniref:Ubiquitin-binding protein cue5 n=1 Tax=Didymosphaeria variabile TaxID=1932322 RepID=A0A9W8XII2_9PLEO|nr:ubiquitin-binding protein cue5 [Didymosphaeria variabile]KAJ4351739.1 ubiquitin-binding protein cue5 [Didymosphaeria variabile]